MGEKIKKILKTVLLSIIGAIALFYFILLITA